MTTFIMHDRGDLSHFLEDDVAAELPWSPVERYAALAEAAALDEKPVIRALRQSKELVGLVGPKDISRKEDIEFLIAAKKLLSPGMTLSRPAAIELEDTLGLPRGQLLQMLRTGDATPTEYTYDPVARYNALAHTFREPKGAKTVEELELLRQSNPDYGSLMPRKERPSLHEHSYNPTSRYHAMAKSLKLPRGHKSLEHLEALRQSDPAYGSLAPSQDRPGLHEVTYDPVRRYNAMAKVTKAPRGYKSVEHLMVLRLSDPAYGSLAPSQDRPGLHELTFEPMRRYAALAKTLKPLRGSKTTEHLEVLRQSDPAYGSLTPSQERTGVHEVTYDPVRRFAAMAMSLKMPRGSKTTEHLMVLRQSDPAYGSLTPSQERTGVHEVTYDPVRRYVAMAKFLKLPRGSKTVEHIEMLRQSDPAYGSLAPSQDRPGLHELTFEPMRRYAALAKTLKPLRGSKTTEHIEILRQSDPAYGSLTPSQERTGVHEVTYDPMRRYVAMAKMLKSPKGAKTVEHLEILRLSDPAFGSLTPMQDRPALHEITYDPQHRYNAMAKFLKLPRGSKTLEHVEILRQSDPAYGTLAPCEDRPGRHELSYEPTRRFAALARSLKSPKGAKTTEHLAELRRSAPTYGSLMPAKERQGIHELSYDPTRRYASLAKLLKGPRGEKPFEHLRNLRLSDPSLGSLSPRRNNSPDNGEDDDDDEDEAAAAAADAAYEARYLMRTRAPSGGSATLGRLPRILSNQAFEPLEDDDDLDGNFLSNGSSPREVPDRYARAWAPPMGTRNPAFYSHSNVSTMPPTISMHEGSLSDRYSERDSVFSNARTSLERMSERSSNDTIASFLDDHDAHASGEWSARDLKLELGLGSEGGSIPASPIATTTPRRGSKEVAWPAKESAHKGATSASAMAGKKKPFTHAPPPPQRSGVSGA